MDKKKIFLGRGCVVYCMNDYNKTNADGPVRVSTGADAPRCRRAFDILKIPDGSDGRRPRASTDSSGPNAYRPVWRALRIRAVAWVPYYRPPGYGTLETRYDEILETNLCTC